MESLREEIAIKKAELDRMRLLRPHGLSNLEHSHDLELTYTSNAIEGNTLTAAETTIVIEQGITVGKRGKTVGGRALFSCRDSARPSLYVMCHRHRPFPR